MAEANQIRCPRCGQAYFVQPQQWAQYHGRTINCTKCGNPFTVMAPPEVFANMGPPGGYSSVPPAGYQPVSPSVPQYPQFQQAPFPSGYMSYPGMMYPQPPKPMSGWAIAGFITSLALFCVPVLGGLFAIIAAIIGIRQTREGRMGGRGLAIAGLAIGLLALVLTPAVETPIVIAAVSKSREQARRTQCASHLKNLGGSLLAYAKAHDESFPAKLEDLARSSTPPVAADFVCPDDDKTPPVETPLSAMAGDIASGKHCSYVYVGDGVKATDDRETVLMYEPLGNHNREGMHVLFADGHVRWLDADDAQLILDQQSQGSRPIKGKAD
jgi:prepilin-type processing-associated H-X9-DG protein